MKTPCMNPDELNKAFMGFVEEARQALCPEQKILESIAIDGKTSRGTARDEVKALHILPSEGHLSWLPKLEF
jgi:hypothetical protein